MDSCQACAEPLTTSQRFCSSCGASAESVELLESAAGPILTEQAVSRGRGLDNKWYLALGALLTVTIGWSILSSPGSQDAAVDETEVADSTTSTAPETSTSDPEEREDSSTTSASTNDDAQADEDDISRDNNSGIPASDASLALVDGPIGDTGLTLVTGNPLRLLNLDTGEVVETGLSGVSPVALIADRLVVSSETSGNTLRSLDINDLEAEAVRFESPNGYLFAFAVGEDPNTIVAIGDNFSSSPSLSRYVFDAATGSVIEETSVEIDFSFYGGWVGAGEFMTPRSGGVYRIDGDSFERVGSGRVVAQGDGLVLIEECDDQLSCDLGWYDGSAYEKVDLPVPDDVTDGQVTAGGRLLVGRSSTQWEMWIFDLETGEVITDRLSEQGEQAMSVSPDNMTVSYGSNGSIFILDLESGTEYEVTFSVRFESSSLGQLLIETP